MSRQFSNATAEQVVAVTEAVALSNANAILDFIEEFTQLRRANADNALLLAQDLGLICESSGSYSISNSLARFLVTNKQQTKAAVLRLLLENYLPFTVFRERLATSDNASAAAHQTKTMLNLDAHRDDVRDTLLSLGTFAQALKVEGGGRYAIADNPIEDAIQQLREIAEEIGACRTRIIEKLGSQITDSLPSDSILQPLAEGLLHGIRELSRESIVQTGNAVESYLLWYGNERGLDVSNASGINARIELLANNGHLPTKLKFVGKYLGHLRNAADHGVDTEVGRAWDFRRELGTEYSTVACGFIFSSWNYYRNNECRL